MHAAVLRDAGRRQAADMDRWEKIRGQEDDVLLNHRQAHLPLVITHMFHCAGLVTAGLLVLFAGR
jgi:hypothetical protein